MARIGGEIMVAAPAGQVLDMAADERDEPRCNPRIVRAEQITGPAPGDGGNLKARYRSAVAAWPVASARWRIPRS